MRLDKNTVAGLGLPEGISDKIHGPPASLSPDMIKICCEDKNGPPPGGCLAETALAISLPAMVTTPVRSKTILDIGTSGIPCATPN